MKIFLIARGIPTKKDPQWGCFEWDQASALHRAGHDVTVLCVDRRLRWYPRPMGVSRGERLGIEWYSLLGVPDSLLRLLGDGAVRDVNRRLLCYLYQKVVKRRGVPDVVYVHYLPMMLAAVGLKQTYGCRVVGMEHWSQVVADGVSGYVSRMAQRTYPQLDALLTVSPYLQQVIKERFGVDSTVVYNMYGEAFSLGPGSGRKNGIAFVAVGSLLPIKHFDMMLDSLHRVKGIDWTLDIIGEGPERPRLEGLIREFGLEKRVRLLGRMGHEEIAKQLRNSDVFLLSSLRETFSVVCIEAMACGLPVISTRCGGPELMVNDRNGVLVAVDDVAAMAAAIEQVGLHLENYNRRFIAEDCEQRFGWKATVQRLEEALKV